MMMKKVKVFVGSSLVALKCSEQQKGSTRKVWGTEFDPISGFKMKSTVEGERNSRQAAEQQEEEKFVV